MLVSFFITLLAVISVFPQSAEEEKPTLKTFGNSLKRLKWDSRKNEAVEIKDKAKQKNASDDDVIRIETTLVVTDVLVLDRKGFLVKGLTKDDFIVTEDEAPQEISSFSLGDDANVPRSIVLIIDNSRSQTSFIDLSVEAAKKLVDKLKPKDRMAIVSDSVKLLSDFTNNKAELKSKLELFKEKSPKGLSLQYSALMATLGELFDDEDIRPIVIFQTDGDQLPYLRPFLPNTPSSITEYAPPFGLKDIYAAADKARATVYTVIPGVRINGAPLNEQLIERVKEQFLKEDYSGYISHRLGNKTATKRQIADVQKDLFNQFFNDRLREQETLENLSKKTGGWAEYLEEPLQAEEIYNRILSNIENRYVIGYYPSNAERDGKRRRVRVEVRNRPDLVILGRKTYIAAEPEK